MCRDIWFYSQELKAAAWETDINLRTTSIDTALKPQEWMKLLRGNVQGLSLEDLRYLMAGLRRTVV